MVPTVHLDGRLVPATETGLDVRDRGLRYGDAARQRLRVYGGEAFLLERHLDRLERSCEHLGLAGAMPPRDDLRDRIAATVAANDRTDALVSVSITRGVQGGGLTPDRRIDPTVIVTVDAAPRGGLDGERSWAEPASVRTVALRAVPAEVTPPECRSHSRVHDVLARLALQEADGDHPTEALRLDGDGTVVTGADSTVFFVDDGTLHTPSRELPIPPTVERSLVLELAGAEPFTVETGVYPLARLRRADEVFLVNTRWEVRPVQRVDGEELSVGPMTALLGRLYDERVEADCY